MPLIVPSIWFQGNAPEAIEFYAQAIGDLDVLNTQHYPTEDLPDFLEQFAGAVMSVDFTLWGRRLQAINAGDEFTPTPGISFLLNLDPAFRPDAETKIDAVWAALAEGGEERMPLQEYPFAKKYGWLKDRYGVEWQLMLTDPDGEPRPCLIPWLMFSGDAQNRCSEALARYTELFPNSSITTTAPYGQPTGNATAEALMFADVALDGQCFAAADDGSGGNLPFSEGVSLAILCDSQEEIDHYVSGLSRVPESELCGWVKDEFGVSWQVQPANLAEILQRPGNQQRLWGMKKIVLSEFE